MLIEVLGPKCDKCTSIKQMAEKLVKEMELDAEVVQVTDMDDIMDFGILATPATVIDGKPFFVGRVPSERELKAKLMGFR